jgi:hypothetical protein
MTPTCEICGDPILGARRSDARFHSSCRRDTARYADRRDLHLVATAEAFWNGYRALKSRRSPRRSFVNTSAEAALMTSALDTHLHSGGAK